MTDEEVIHAAYDRINGWNTSQTKRWRVPVYPAVADVPFGVSPVNDKATFTCVEFEFVQIRDYIHGQFAEGIIGTYKETTIVVKNWLAPHIG